MTTTSLKGFVYLGVGEVSTLLYITVAKWWFCTNNNFVMLFFKQQRSTVKMLHWNYQPHWCYVVDHCSNLSWSIVKMLHGNYQPHWRYVVDRCSNHFPEWLSWQPPATDWTRLPFKVTSSRWHKEATTLWLPSSRVQQSFHLCICILYHWWLYS